MKKQAWLLGFCFVLLGCGRVENAGDGASGEPTPTPMPLETPQPASTPALAMSVQVVPQIPEFANLSDAEQEAVRRYPQLGVQGSQLNNEFLALHNQFKQDHPEYFRNFSWPITLAREAYRLIGTSVQNEQTDTAYICAVTFKMPLPRSDEVDAIVREYLNEAILQHRGKDIIANAFNEGGDALKDNTTPGPYDYSGSLIYRTATGVVETEADSDRARGKTVSDTQNAEYFVEVEHNQGLVGNKYIFIYVVYPNQPTIDDADAAVIAEIKNLPDRDSEISAFVMIGDKDSRSSWTQMPDPDGGNFGANYDPSTQTVTTGNINHPRTVVPLHG